MSDITKNWIINLIVIQFLCLLVFLISQNDLILFLAGGSLLSGAILITKDYMNSPPSNLISRVRQKLKKKNQEED